jgi:archaeosortase B (VPXXXP-CTERM-specific)
MASMRRKSKAITPPGRHGDGVTPDTAPAGSGGNRLAIGSRRALGRYLGLFMAFAVGLFALYQVSEATHHFRHVNVTNATICGKVLGWIGIRNQTVATNVSIGTTSMEIISECSAIYVAILFTAGVLAFPTTWRARWRGLAFGLPCIFVINILRLVSLGIVIQYRAALLPLFHEYLWQVLFVLVVAVLYLLWIERFVPREATRQAA